MEHKEAVERNIAELYFKQELSEEDEAAFEEHLLYCKECRDRLRMIEKTAEAIERSRSEKFRGMKSDEEKRRVLPYYIWMLRIAALILLIVGLASVTLLLLRKEKAPSPVPAITDSFIDTIPDTVPVEKTGSDIKTTNGIKDNYLTIYAENFIPSPFYENIIENNLRNEGIRVISPLNDTLAELPSFRWSGGITGNLTLVIVSNSEAGIYKGQIANGSMAEITIEPGLYYWQLQDTDETLVTGRFVYLPSDYR